MMITWADDYDAHIEYNAIKKVLHLLRESHCVYQMGQWSKTTQEAKKQQFESFFATKSV